MVEQEELQRRLRDAALCRDVFLAGAEPGVADLIAGICTGSPIEIPKAIAQLRLRYRVWCSNWNDAATGHTARVLRSVTRADYYVSAAPETCDVAYLGDNVYAAFRDDQLIGIAAHPEYWLASYDVGKVTL